MVIDIDWKDVLKKEARGSNDEDLGEVQEIINDKIIVQRGIINKEKFYLPQNQVEIFDGAILRFHISSDQISKYSEDSGPPSIEDQYTSTTTIDSGGGSAGGIKMDEKEDTTISSADINFESKLNDNKITKQPTTET